jgi:hypothetical protein
MDQAKGLDHLPSRFIETHRPPRNTIVCTFFLLLSAALFWPAWRHPRTVAVGLPWDPAILTWFIRWHAFALAHGINPLFSNYMNYPTGLNLMWNTSLFLPAVLLAPITVWLGPVFTYNLIATLGMGLSAFVAYLALRRFVEGHWLASFLGALLYGFSPYMLAESAGRIHISFALFPPLLVILLDEILVRNRLTATRAGALLGLTTAVQFLISSEIVAVSGIVGTLTILILIVLRPADIPTRISRAARSLLVAVVVFLAITVVPLVYLFAGPQAPTEAIHPTNTWVSDLEGFVLPTEQMRLSTAQTIRITSRFTGNEGEQTSYVGVPLILIVVWAGIRFRHSTGVRLVLLSSLAVAVLSLGPRLHVGGHITQIPLPWAALEAVPGPIFRNLLPIRLMLFVFLGFSFILALFVRSWNGASRSKHRLGGALLTGLVFASFVPRLPYPALATKIPPFFSSPNVQRIPEGSVALLLPLFETQRSALLWQEASNFRFRVPTGFFVGPKAARTPASSALLTSVLAVEQTGRPTVTDRQTLEQGLRDLHVRTVVVGPAEPPTDRAALVRYFTTVLNAPPEEIGGVDIWFS